MVHHITCTEPIKHVTEVQLSLGEAELRRMPILAREERTSQQKGPIQHLTYPPSISNAVILPLAPELESVYTNVSHSKYLNIISYLNETSTESKQNNPDGFGHAKELWDGPSLNLHAHQRGLLNWLSRW